ncbi:ankyrin1, partial [Fusarium albosuccineum]
MTAAVVRFLSMAVLATTVAAADDAEFAFNLLSDVAPILALFGDQFAKQFMSESLTWVDHLIFAMVPLGIVT